MRRLGCGRSFPILRSNRLIEYLCILAIGHSLVRSVPIFSIKVTAVRHLGPKYSLQPVHRQLCITKNPEVWLQKPLAPMLQGEE